MSDEPQPVAFPEQGAGQLPAKQEEQQPQYITRAELDEALELAVRRAQSSTDKAISSVRKDVEAKLKKLDEVAAALGASKEDVAQARRQIISQALTNITGEDEAGANQPYAEPEIDLEQAEKAAETNAKLARLNKQFGFWLAENEPEARTLRNISDPDAFVIAYQQALVRKAQRLNKAIPEGLEVAPPEARMPSVTSAGPAGNRIEQLTAELERLQANPSGNWKRIAEITKELQPYLPRK